MPSLSLDSTLIARVAGGLYGQRIGAATMTEARELASTMTPDGLFNALYVRDFGSMTTEAVAKAIVVNLGIIPNTAAIGEPADEATAFIKASLDAASAATRGAAVASVLNQFSALTSNATYGAFATAFNNNIANALSYANTAGTLDTAYGNAIFSLGRGVDNLVGTTGNDTFNAIILDNGNTLQSGDLIVGGQGTDTLNADIGNSQNFAITAESSSVEVVNIRAEARGNDSNNNNMWGSATGTLAAGPNAVQIDAERMKDVTKWASVNSRADVIIEDVRIAPGDLTKSITIEFTQSDPGNVDLGVYFNQLSLRNVGSGTSTLNLYLMDLATNKPASTVGYDPTKPIKDHAFGGFTFYITSAASPTPTKIALADPSIDAAVNYTELKAAFDKAIAANPLVAGQITTSLSAVQTIGIITDPTNKSIDFDSLQGQILTLEAKTNVTISTPMDNAAGTSGWKYASIDAPASGNIAQSYTVGSTTTTELVTSKIILDDVGMGSTGGDLVVGGMSVGETSTSRGVERFEITVNDNSKLQTINSTNNALREVTIINGPTTSTSNNITTSAGPNATSTDAATASGNTAYTTTVANAGNLTVNGNVNLTFAGTGTVANSNSDTILKGVNNANGINGYTADHHGAFGFTDVRLIDASLFKGKLGFTAQITPDSIAKYMILTDTAANPAADISSNVGNVNFDVLGGNQANGGNFTYIGGTGDDTMSVVIDGAVVASRSTKVSGQPDFTFNISGGTGVDVITVQVANTANNGATLNWYNNQNFNNNITISGGDGNDWIRTPGAGDTTIDAGTGNDTIYTDNTGAQVVNVVAGSPVHSTAGKAVWVFNTTDQASLSLTAARNINDLRSDANDNYNLYKAAMTVTFLGLPSTPITLSNTSTNPYKVNDLEINQAIKNAINLNATLSKLLIARDGPANSLVVESLIDGVMATTDLVVSWTLPATTDLSTAEVTAAGAAYGLTSPTAATVIAAMTTGTSSLAAYTTKGDYATAMATDGVANIVGLDSTSSSDNFITPGTGDDVIVLGTTGTNLAVATVNAASNEVVTIGTTTAGSNFGNDVIVNFDAGAGVAHDHLIFAYLGTPSGVNTALTALTNNQITVAAATTTLANATAVQTAARALDTAVSTAAGKQIFVSVSTHNVGTVYSISNGTAVGDAVATQEGTIDLADVAWGSLTLANFTSPTSVYEDALTTGAVAPPPPGGGGAVPVTGAGTSNANLPAGNYTFNFAAPTASYAYTISNFGVGDVLNFAATGTLPTFVNDAATDGDGTQVMTLAAAGGTITLTLTGLTPAQDAGVFNVPSFNGATMFGAGSLI